METCPARPRKNAGNAKINWILEFWNFGELRKRGGEKRRQGKTREDKGRGRKTTANPQQQQQQQPATMFARSALRQAVLAASRPAALARFRFASTLSKEDVLTRSVAVLKTFEIKTPEQPITLSTQFGKDLGMDSLDYNDALVALEEEFDVVFDDNVANEITTVGEAVEYITKNAMPEEDLLDKEIR